MAPIGLRLPCALVLALASLAPIAGAGASTALGPPPGSPDPKLMVLVGSDLGGASVTGQHYYRDRDLPSVVSYERDFGRSRAGRTGLVAVGSQAEVGTSEQSTETFLLTTRRLFETKRGRALLKKEFAKGIGTGGLATNLQVGRPRPVGIGAEAFDVSITFDVLGLRTVVHVALFRVERVLGTVFVVGAPGSRVPRTVTAGLGRVMAGRASAQLIPRSVAPPVISGTAQAARTLTASPGTWAGAPPTFTYRWQRCRPPGSCLDVPTATGQTYLLTYLDAGATLRVVVTATNALGSATAVSAPTAIVVAGPVSARPTNIVPPTISGELHAGETLTATTGSWTNHPTTFTFSWQRCDSTSTPTCLPTRGQGQTYVLAAADLGSLMVVYAIACNAAGCGSARSAPTAQVS